MKNMKKLTAMLMAICMMAALTACGSEDDPAYKIEKTAEEAPSAVCFVLGNTEVFPKISLLSAKDTVYNCMYNYSSVSAFVADGQPALDFDVKAQRPDAVTQGKRKSNANKQTEAVLSALQNLKAEEPETDLLGAVIKASHTLRASDAEQKIMEVYSSGLSTAGMLNFSASNLLEADPAWVVEELNCRNALPDLTGIEVTVRGIGQVAGHQSPLDETAIRKLEAIWGAILQAGNPAKLDIDRRELTGEAPAEGLPACSSVTVVSSALTMDAPSIEEQVYRIDSIHFVSDTADFIDPAAASAAVQPFADALSGRERIILAGSIASVGTGDGIALSAARAEAVKALFLEEGVSAEQIRAVGLGKQGWSLRVSDLDANGNLIEEKAALNRAVFLIPEGSQVAVELGF